MVVEGDVEEVGRTAVGFMGCRRVPSDSKGDATAAPILMAEPGSQNV